MEPCHDDESTFSDLSCKSLTELNPFQRQLEPLCDTSLVQAPLHRKMPTKEGQCQGARHAYIEIDDPLPGRLESISVFDYDVSARGAVVASFMEIPRGLAYDGAQSLLQPVLLQVADARAQPYVRFGKVLPAGSEEGEVAILADEERCGKAGGAFGDHLLGEECRGFKV